MGCDKLTIFTLLTIIQKENITVSRILFLGKYSKELDHLLTQLQLHRCYVQRGEVNNQEEIKQEVLDNNQQNNNLITQLNSLDIPEISSKIYEKYFTSEQFNF